MTARALMAALARRLSPSSSGSASPGGRGANSTSARPSAAPTRLGLALGLVALPKATHLTSYSYRVRRSSNVALTRSVLTFFAQDHASTEMVYANADITKAEQAARLRDLLRLTIAGQYHAR